ncbi:hypothetical protein PE067_08260 [Paracoccus sp. DMF-8]|uniref:phage head-tail joining protein n=1 Tax=Paracoccus sp. DMF-8 TaxID=3019445 RepID=UPI0023E7FCAF|nr:hypothetical protein [Paracoccus sp. DMF-8]MDF3606120.1 hypothetical protein [Paracoccus sp. DMF-8]
MPYTRADADQLRAAIAKGAAEVQVNGERVRFRSLAEMREALNMIEAELAGQSASSFRVSYPLTTRGL